MARDQNEERQAEHLCARYPLAGRTTTSTYHRVAARILLQCVTPGSNQALVDAQENVACFNRIVEGVSHSVIVDLRRAVTVSKEARDYYNSDVATRSLTASALLVDGAAGRMIGNFFLLVTRPLRPCRLFPDDVPALDWLKAVAAA